MKPVRIGCSGWNYDDWRGRFYPQGEPRRRWLELYAERFDTVEVNATFYRLPTRKATAAWATQTPEGFTFAVKASRYLTHVKRLTELREGLAILRGSPALRLGLYQLALALVVVFTVFALGPAYMVNVLHRSDQDTYIVLVPATFGLVGTAALLGQRAGFPRALTLVLSFGPLGAFAITYQRFAAKPLPWWGLPGAFALFALYGYFWAVPASVRALARIASGRGSWVKTPRVAVSAHVLAAEAAALARAER